MIAATNLAARLLCVAIIGSGISSVIGQHFKHIRPQPNNNLPLQDIPENPDPIYNPRPADIDPRKLRAKLGVDYLPRFMSHRDPGDRGLRSPVKPPKPRPTAEIRQVFRRLTKSKFPRRGIRRYFKQRRLIQGWLWQATACQVHYRWKDLGIRYWPRYIKEGYCDTSQSCSIPAGMHCHQSGQTGLKILRWFCQGISEQKYCLWREMHYPIISECRCQCP
uniref:Noggin n=1 Tax=Ciona savignyi TaxID=51511 RepID=H2ZKH6_CIOSA